jgi:ATP-dependent RNA helicase DDX3X
MESFDDVHDALRDVINNPPELTADDDDGKKPAQDPRVAGWTEPTPFSYDNYQNKEFTDWAGMAARYEWNDEYGDVGPRNEELEKQLFNLEFMSRAGVRFDE